MGQKREVISITRETKKYKVQYQVSGNGARAFHEALQEVFDKVDNTEDDNE